VKITDLAPLIIYLLPEHADQDSSFAPLRVSLATLLHSASIQPPSGRYPYVTSYPCCRYHSSRPMRTWCSTSQMPYPPFMTKRRMIYPSVISSHHCHQIFLKMIRGGCTRYAQGS